MDEVTKLRLLHQSLRNCLTILNGVLEDCRYMGIDNEVSSSIFDLMQQANATIDIVSNHISKEIRK